MNLLPEEPAPGFVLRGMYSRADRFYRHAFLRLFFLSLSFLSRRQIWPFRNGGGKKKKLFICSVQCGSVYMTLYFAGGRPNP